MTSDDLLVPALLGLVVLVLVLLLVMTTVALRRERVQARADLKATRDQADQLRDQVDALARQMEVRRTPDEFVITDIGREEAGTDRAPTAETNAEEFAEPQRIEGRLFVDLVMRESVVKAASLTHGVRRALAPDTRNRIRFAMKQEVKRSRKERRIELREVRREMAARRSGEKSAGNPAGGRTEGAA